MTHSRSDLQRLLDDHGLRPSRAFGQNFVVDPNTVRRIVRVAGVVAGDRVVEIGAGLGSLTLALAEVGAQVEAVEADRRLVPVLRSVVEARGYGGSVQVVEADALELDWIELLERGGAGDPRPWTLVANLPYNVATALVVRVLEEAPQVTRLLVMVQREVGERWVAGPGSSAYGAVSVRIAYWATGSIAGTVPSTVFHPRPKVDSVLVDLHRRPEVAVSPSAVSYGRLFEVVRAGFGQRRKMLRRSLSGLVSPEAFAAAGISPSQRAEELDLEAWGRLARWPGPTA